MTGLESVYTKYYNNIRIVSYNSCPTLGLTGLSVHLARVSVTQSACIVQIVDIVSREWNILSY